MLTKNKNKNPAMSMFCDMAEVDSSPHPHSRKGQRGSRKQAESRCQAFKVWLGSCTYHL